MTALSHTQPETRTTLTPNTIVALICAGMAVFILCVASVCGALMRADAAMMAIARPKICLVPRDTGKRTPPISSDTVR